MDTFLIHKLTGIQESEAAELASDLPVMSRSRAEALAAEIQAKIRALASESQSRS